MSLLALARAAVTLVGAYALAACGPPIQTAQVRSNAISVAPAGPVASGPMLARGRVALGGSITTVVTAATEPAPSGGAASAVHTVVRARVSVGVDPRVELGAHVEFADSRWRRSTIVGDGPAAPDERLLVHGGLQVRLALLGSETLGLRWVNELALTGLPYRATATLDFSSFGRPPTAPITRHDVAVRPSLLSGLYGVFGPARGLQLAVGVGAGAEPAPRTSFQTQWEGSDPGDALSPFELHAYFVAFGWAAYTLGDVTFLAQVAGGTSAVSPFGGTLGFRVTL